VNLGFARAAGVPALLVGDIDRGGVFASFVRTIAVLEAADQAHIAGFLISKFRGDVSLLSPGLVMLEELTGRPALGVLPFATGIGIDAEDAIDWALLRSGGAPLDDDVLRVVVVALPRMSNHTDVDPLAVEPGVVLRFARPAAGLADADLIVLPGTRATVKDLTWVRDQGIDAALRRHVASGRPLLGISVYPKLDNPISDERVGPPPGVGRRVGRGDILWLMVLIFGTTPTRSR
jgi:adenosylcobyric acid synthase